MAQTVKKKKKKRKYKTKIRHTFAIARSIEASPSFAPSGTMSFASSWHIWAHRCMRPCSTTAAASSQTHVFITQDTVRPAQSYSMTCAYLVQIHDTCTMARCARSCAVLESAVQYSTHAPRWTNLKIHFFQDSTLFDGYRQQSPYALGKSTFVWGDRHISTR